MPDTTDVTDRMRACLVEAMQEHHQQVYGEPFSPAGLCGVLGASLREGSEGFLRETLWRALQIATDPEALRICHAVSEAFEKANGHTDDAAEDAEHWRVLAEAVYQMREHFGLKVKAEREEG